MWTEDLADTMMRAVNSRAAAVMTRTISMNVVPSSPEPIHAPGGDYFNAPLVPSQSVPPAPAEEDAASAAAPVATVETPTEPVSTPRVGTTRSILAGRIEQVHR